MKCLFPPGRVSLADASDHRHIVSKAQFDNFGFQELITYKFVCCLGERWFDERIRAATYLLRPREEPR